ncbi:MAG TPA: hypothetical protein VKZ97_04725 [Flavobacteriaceae bacterium]|nr:hypothetical protein [Flavobacteriaceae bacterium]
MKLFLISCLISVCFLSCKDATEVAPAAQEPIVYDMYVPSEMANLMNEMYAYNLKVKQEILDGKQPTEFPLEFLKIHSAEFTKGKGRNDTFESFSKLFIEAEKEIYNPDSEIDLKERFNNSVNLCISCHQTECTGPIPRIKKLLIQ